MLPYFFPKQIDPGYLQSKDDRNPVDISRVKPGDYKMVMFNEMENGKKFLGEIEFVMEADLSEALFHYREFMENDVNPNKMNALSASSANRKFYSNMSEDLNFGQIRSDNAKYYRLTGSDKNQKLEDHKRNKENRKIHLL